MADKQPEKPKRYFVLRPFKWNRRNPETDEIENVNVPPGTLRDMKPSDAAMLVAAKKIEEYDEKNQKHAKAVEDAKAKAAKPNPSAPVKT